MENLCYFARILDDRISPLICPEFRARAIPARGSNISANLPRILTPIAARLSRGEFPVCAIPAAVMENLGYFAPVFDDQISRLICPEFRVRAISGATMKKPWLFCSDLGPFLSVVFCSSHLLSRGND